MVRYNYDAWGNHSVAVKDETCAQLAELNPFRYRSYYYDVETKLYYLQTRYYDPELGRFISQDGVEYAEPETINGINLYAYCGNNPVMYVDPTGEAKWWQWLILGLAVLGVGVLSAITGGVAGAVAGGIASGLGFTSFGAGAVGTIVGITAFLSSASIGTIELINQVANKGVENINFGSIAISTIFGGLDGAIVAGSIFTGIGGKFALSAVRTGFSGLKTYLYGLSEGYDNSKMNEKLFSNLLSTAISSMVMLLPNQLSLLSLALKPLITSGVKTLFGVINKIWDSYLKSLIF